MAARLPIYRCCWLYNSQIVVRDFVSKQEANIASGQDEIRWSPDSQLLAFLTDRRSDTIAKVRSVAGGSDATLPTSTTPVWLP